MQNADEFELQKNPIDIMDIMTHFSPIMINSKKNILSGVRSVIKNLCCYLNSGYIQ